MALECVGITDAGQPGSTDQGAILVILRVGAGVAAA